MFKFLKNILNTDESKKLSDFMRDNSIEFRTNSELNNLFREYLNVLKLEDTYSSIVEKNSRINMIDLTLTQETLLLNTLKKMNYIK